MKNLKIQFITLVLICLPAFSFAVEQVITLKDGSQVKGEMVGLSEGIYTIRTSSFGDVKVESSKIANIADASWAANSTMQKPTSGGNTSIDQKISETQNRIMSDPQAMNAVKEMMADPEMMKLLTDPEIAQAAMAHDAKAIENNPKAQELMNNPKMKALIEQMAQGNSSR